MTEQQFLGRLGVIQRVLPAYRAPFFDALAAACRGGLSLFAGEPGAEEAIAQAAQLERAHWVQARSLAPLPAANPLYLLWQQGIGRWLAGWQPDVLVVEANSRYLSSRYAVRWMHARGKLVIGWGLGAPVIPGRGLLPRLRRWERATFLRSLDGVIAYSRRGAQEYRQLGFASGQVWVAPNATAPRPPGPPPERAPVFSGAPRVLFVGRLQERKRIDLLLRACAALPVSLRPLVDIVGSGPARAKFEQLARTLYPQARFAGERRGLELEQHFRQADLFVLPGTGGLAVQQAMAHALPVIVAEGDGTQDDLVTPSNGWRVEPGSLESLTDCLAEALADPARLRRMGRESFRIVQEEANLEHMVLIFVEAANACLENSSRS
jgi:glycosyltransferase involved in cell wall biosynthesis